MINEISRILELFRSCFTRSAAFNWFVVVIFGFMVRLDHHGVSSFVRWLCIKPRLYTSLLSFFRSSSRLLMTGDGIKISKEAEKMPGVKKLHQESDNSGKAPYIYGHHHGVIGILAGWVKKTVLYSPVC